MVIGKFKCDICGKELQEVAFEFSGAFITEKLFSDMLVKALDQVKPKVKVHSTRCQTVLSFHPEKRDAVI